MSDLSFDVEFRTWTQAPETGRTFGVTGYLDNANTRDFGNGATLPEAFMDCLSQIEQRLRNQAANDE